MNVRRLACAALWMIGLLCVASKLPAQADSGTRAANTGSLLIPAPGSPIAAGSGGVLIAGDITGDGCADLVMTAGKTLSIFFGGANRVWNAKPNLEVDLQSPASEAAIADVNHDERNDLLLADHDSYDVTVLLGSGDGKFSPATGSPFAARAGNQPHTHGLVVGDVNGDGHADIVTANNSDGDVSLLLGSGDGRFFRAAKSPFACGKSPYPIATSDVDGDGCADVLVPNATHGDGNQKTFTFLLGNQRGALTTAASSPLSCAATVWYAAASDLNGDKRPDIVAMHSEGNTGATIFLNAGQGNFVAAPGSPLKLDHGAWGVEIADMNRDGKADLVIAADESIRVLLGEGNGRFARASGSPFKTGKGAWRLTVADFNGDGKPDVATRCVEANRIEVFMSH